MYQNEEIIEMGGAVAYEMVRLWLIGEWQEWKEGQEERAMASFGVQRQDDWLEMSRMRLDERGMDAVVSWSKQIGLLDGTGMWLSPKVGVDGFLARWVEAVGLIPVGWRCKVLSACLVSPFEMGWCGHTHTQMDLYERVRRVADGEVDIKEVEDEAEIVLGALCEYRVAAEMTVDAVVARDKHKTEMQALTDAHRAHTDKMKEKARIRDEEAARRTAELQRQAKELRKAAEEGRIKKNSEESNSRIFKAFEKEKAREEKRKVKEGREIANRLLFTSGVYKHLGWRAKVREREAAKEAEKRARVISRLGLTEADCDGVSTQALLEVWHKQARERRGC